MVLALMLADVGLEARFWVALACMIDFKSK